MPPARADRATSARGASSATQGAGPTQQLVRATMARVGGYWRPLAALARLLEELGELAELLRDPVLDERELALELADLWIITTALGDQFLGEVAEPGSLAGTLGAAGDPFAALVAAAGQIARIVNYYDGPKTPRSSNGWPSLDEAVAQLHRALAQLAQAHGVELGAAVADKLRAIPVRDAARFARTEHDPSTAPCLEQFRLLQDTPWGARVGEARLWGAPAWSGAGWPGTASPGAGSPRAASPGAGWPGGSTQSPAATANVAANVAAIVPTLSSFTRAAARERLEGYVISGPALDSALDAGEWARAVLGELAAQNPRREPDAPEAREDPAGAAAMPDGRTPLRLRFNEVLLSASVIAPQHQALPARHSVLATQHPHVLLQLSDVEREDRAR